MEKKENRFKRAYWPDVSNIESAKKAILNGVWAAAIVSFLTAIVSLTQVLGYTYWNFLDAGLFALIAFGIYKYSRVASVSGFILYAIERLYGYSQGQNITSSIVLAVVLAVIFLLAFYNSIRGTFAYHRLIEDQDVSIVQPTKQDGVNYCTRCGKPSSLNSNYCIHCGNPLAGIKVS